MFTKPPLVYSNCFIREEIYGGKVKFYFNKKALREEEEEILKVLILYFLNQIIKEKHSLVIERGEMTGQMLFLVFIKKRQKKTL